jgi:hypothetical protein
LVFDDSGERLTPTHAVKKGTRYRYYVSPAASSSLAPDIVTAIINGKHPPALSAKRLMRLALKLPTDSAQQRGLLGFSMHRAS